MARMPRPASTEDVRNWGRANGHSVGDRGRLRSEVITAFDQAHRRNNIKYVPGTVESVFDNTATASPATATTASAPTPRKATPSAQSTPVIMTEGGDDEVAATRELVAALSAAPGGNKKGGRAILLTARTIAYVS